MTIGGTSTSGDINIGANQTVSGNITLGNSSSLFDFGLLYINKSTIIDSFKSLYCNTYQPTSETSQVSLFGNSTTGNITLGAGLTTGNITLGNATPASDSGTLTINKNTVVATSKSLTCDTFTGNGATTAISLFGTTTASNIALGAVQTSGNITLGNTTPASDLGTLTINKVVVLPANKTITLNSTGGSVLSPAFNSTSATQALTIGGSNTTASITIGGALTSGAINLGLIGQSGAINVNSDINIGTSAVNKGIVCNYLSNFNNSDLMRFAPILTTGNVRIGETQTTGGVTIGHTTPASDSGTLTINKNTVVATSKSLSTPTINSLGSGSPITIGGNITGSDITIGGAITTGSIYLGPSGSTSGFGVVSRMKAEFRTTTGSSYINTSSGNTLFSSASLTNKYLSSTMYIGANTDSFSVWESNAQGGGNDEAAAICQNGNTTIFINPGDHAAFFWLDEDVMTTANNYAWVGFKFNDVGDMTKTSDVRIKRDITPLTNTNLLDKLSLIQYVNYKKKPRTEEQLYKDGELRPKYEAVHKGVIAQDVMEIFPDVVDRENEDAFWTVKYQEVDIYFNMGVQELIKRDKEKQQQIDDLTARVTSLEAVINRMSAIESRLAALESMT